MSYFAHWYIDTISCTSHVYRSYLSQQMLLYGYIKAMLFSVTFIVMFISPTCWILIVIVASYFLLPKSASFAFRALYSPVIFFFQLHLSLPPLFLCFWKRSSASIWYLMKESNALSIAFLPCFFSGPTSLSWSCCNYIVCANVNRCDTVCASLLKCSVCVCVCVCVRVHACMSVPVCVCWLPCKQRVCGYYMCICTHVDRVNVQVHV